MSMETIQGFELSPQQKRLWALQRDGQAPFFGHAVVLIEGELDRERLEAALRDLVTRHEILRTRFERAPGLVLPLQVILDPQPPALPIHDLRGAEGEVQRELWRSLLRELEEGSPGDGGRPALRACLAELGERRHLLLLSLPALNGDSATLDLLAAELSRTYRCIRGGRAEAEPPLQYADLAQWQNELLETDGAGGAPYWGSFQPSEEDGGTLPCERRASGGPTPFAPVAATASLPAAVAGAVRDLTERSAVSLSAFFLAAWQVLLWRLGAGDRIVVGTLFDGRGPEDLRSALGPFSKLLPAPATPDPGETFAEAARKTEALLRAHRDWQDLYTPWREAAGGGPRTFSFAFEHRPEPPQDGSGEPRFSVLESGACADPFKLRLVASERQGALRLDLQYDPIRFDRPAVLALLEQLATLVGGAAREPRTRIGELPVLDDRALHHVACELNDTDAAFGPGEPLLHRPFERQALATPEAVALEFETGSLSYRELDDLSGRLAGHLLALGLRPEQRVALCLEPSPEMVVALLAVLRAGGAYVPLDPAYPPERLALMARDTEAVALLTRESLAGRAPGLEGPVILLEPGWPDRMPSPAGLKPAVDPDGAAYVIFTSGSTGAPKGAVLSHRAICNRLQWMIATFSLTAGDRFVQKTPYSFDASIWEFFVPLWIGAPLVLARTGGHQDPPYLLGLVAARKVTVLQMVPSLLELLLQDGGLISCAALRYLFSGGEALSAEARRRVSEQTRAVLVNLYGPTEAAIDATSWDCRRESRGGGGVPIGRPISNDQVYVVDPAGNLVPPGVPGELRIGGCGLARGYLRRPDLTAERFVPDPWGGRPGGRLYRTGDLARQLPGGEIEVIGRIDHQVKVRGLRIELGEVEAALASRPEVGQAVVVVREDAPGERRLVAYLVGDPERLPGVEDLRSSLGRRLPEHMIPAAFVILQELPRLPNGKVDRRALPAPDGSRPLLRKPYVAPRTEAERRLAAIWSAVLGLREVGVEDNFFELGGDSILSIQIVSRAREAGLRIAPRQMFQHQTIAELAAVADLSAPVRGDQEAVVGPVPLTPIQHDFFARGLEDLHHYNQSVLLAVRQPLPGAVFRALIGDLLARHDALRLRFWREGGIWSQESPAPGGEVPAGEVDLSGLPAERRGKATEEAAAAAQSSLDLAAGPLVRAVLFRNGAGEEDRLLLVVHHLAIDGVSWRILLEDLQQGWAAGGSLPASAKTTSFKAWAERLAAHAPDLRGDLAHWLEEARAAAAVPADFPETPGANLESTAEFVSTIFPPEETRVLSTRAQETHRAGVREVLLAALAEALLAWTGGRPLLVDLEAHGREEIFPDVDLSRTVGWLTSVFPVLLDTGRAAAPGAALQAIREKLARVPHNGLSFGVLRYLDGEVGESLGVVPSARIAFNYLGQVDQALSAGSPFGPAPESPGRGQSSRQRRRYLLELNALITEGRLVVSWSYSGRVHRRETIERLAASFQGAIRRVIAEIMSGRETPSPSLADFPLATSLDTEALSRLLQAGPVEDLYPLSPLQQGLLFDVVRSPGGGAYVQQVGCRLSGALREDLFARAWQRIVDRHTILRTGFAWEDLEEPLQVVRPSVTLPWRDLDWTGVGAEEQRRGLERLLAEDREEGFDVTRPPLMRLTLVRLAERSYELLWTSHHLVLDGWSVPLIVAELVAGYEALRAGREPEVAAAILYRRYIEWLRRQSLGEAEAYWRKTLRGFTRPTPIGGEAAGEGRGHLQRTLEIPEELTARLKALVQQRQLTLNTLVQGAWGLLLSRLSGRQDLVFGIVVSGRPADLQGSGEIVGMFVSTLPVRVRVEPSLPFPDWLRRLQDEQAEARQHEHSPLSEVRRWSEVPAGQPLFESTFAFNNYPTTDALSRDGSSFRLEEVRWQEQTGYPLDCTVGLGTRLAVRLMYDSGRIETSRIERLAEELESLLGAIAERPDRPLSDLIEFLDSAGSRRKAAKGENAVIESPMFKKVKPKAVSLPASEIVGRSYLDSDRRLPLVLQPASPEVDLADWAASHRDAVDADLVRHGAILFRGFGIDTPPVFERFAASVCSELFNENGEHPRESVSGNVYTPVFYPAEKQLLWHNENSFNHRWPTKILFCCVHPAEQGGETPVVDSRKVFECLDPEVRAPFVEKGILYVRSYGEGVGLDWRAVFQTEDRARVEEQCREDRMNFEWKSGDRLKTLARRPAVIPHPKTGELSWFNQAQHWHVSCLDEATRESVRALFSEQDLPRNCYYGDGTSIPDDHMAHILDVYRRLETAFPWQRGDVMLVDNVLAAHGRNEYVGRRKLLVALGDMMTFEEP
jgi:amino acid adenylation domain-containing protein/non-ribosomal peptide synthase protein (TIGR01720 family)